jgi:hypothetical protein
VKFGNFPTCLMAAQYTLLNLLCWQSGHGEVLCPSRSGAARGYPVFQAPSIISLVVPNTLFSASYTKPGSTNSGKHVQRNTVYPQIVWDSRRVSDGSLCIFNSICMLFHLSFWVHLAHALSGKNYNIATFYFCHCLTSKGGSCWQSI